MCLKGDEKMKPSIFNVAAYVIDKCGEMTTMKLEKLVYYCQAWSLAWDGEPLFEEEFEAWANGPVSPTLFAKHKGKFRVGKETFSDVDLTMFNKDQIATMDAVIRDLGNKTSHWLSDLTHSEIPWQEARNGCSPGERCSNIIDKDSMQQYYGSL